MTDTGPEVWHDEGRMNSASPPSPVVSAGKQIVTWLTVVQVISVVSAVAALALALSGRTQSGVPVSRTLDVTASAVQVLLSVAYVLALQPTKRWLTHTRHWATGDGTPDPKRAAHDARSLRGWLWAGQILPIVGTLVAVPLLWYAFGQGVNTPEVQEQLRRQGGQALTPETARTAVQVFGTITAAVFLLPSVIINWSVLGWVRRWLTGVTDALVGRPVGEPKLGAVTETLGRWFTFFQGLLVFLILMVLAVPLVGLPQETGLDRVTLLVAFLNLSLQVALLQWTKTFMAGVMRRVAGER